MSTIYQQYTVAEMAKFFMRYYSQVTNGLWDLSANAPAELRQFMTRLPVGQLHSMVPVALALIAQGKRKPVTPDRDTVLDWVMNFPDADKRIDAMLASKNPPTSMAAILERVYVAEYNAVYEALLPWLQEQVARWN